MAINWHQSYPSTSAAAPTVAAFSQCPIWPHHTIIHRKGCKCCPTNKRKCICSVIKTIFECRIQCSRKPSIIFFYVIFLWWWMYSATRWRMSSFGWEVFQPGLANISIDWTWLSNSVIGAFQNTNWYLNAFDKTKT